MQRIFQIGEFKTRLEVASGKRLTVEDLSRLWNSRVKVSSGEAITPNFLQAAVLAWDWLLKKDSTRSLIVQAGRTLLFVWYPTLFAFCSAVGCG